VDPDRHGRRAQAARDSYRVSGAVGGRSSSCRTWWSGDQTGWDGEDLGPATRRCVYLGRCFFLRRFSTVGLQFYFGTVDAHSNGPRTGPALSRG